MFVSQVSGPFGGSLASTAFTNNGLARNQIVIQERHNAPTVDVEGGGGMVQRVPWNVPGFGDAAMFGAFGLTEDETQKLAERIRDATFGTDIQAILSIVPTTAERQAVATRAIAIGADATRVNQALASLASESAFKNAFKVSKPVAIFWSIASIASTGLGAYHGYKRNNSIGWALWWALMGGIFPIVTPGIAFAQGFGKPKASGFGRARRARRARNYRRRARS